jgi:acylphosphatase
LGRVNGGSGSHVKSLLYWFDRSSIFAMNEDTKHERRQVLFRGHVQGVGFRYTTRQIAAAFAVSGYVQNLSDGSVRLVAEGAPKELNRFVQEISAELSQYVRDVQVSASPATGEFQEFEIRH